MMPTKIFYIEMKTKKNEGLNLGWGSNLATCHKCIVKTLIFIAVAHMLEKVMVI